MKASIPTFLVLVLLLTATGCEQMRFAQYSGQQAAWPTGTAFAARVFDVPVYMGWPEKPYTVLGYIEFNNPNVDWNQGDIKQAARQAKQMGADAIIMMPRGETISPTAADTRKHLRITGSQTVAVAAKWK